MAMLTLALNFNVVVLADGASGLQQMQVKNAEFGEVSREIRIIWNRSIVTSPVIARAPLHMIIDASRSTGGNLKFAWDFGDGTLADGPYIEHTYNSVGEYNLKLVVSNDVDREIVDLVIRISNDSEISVVPIPFSFDEEQITKGDILSNYEYLFAFQEKEVIHVQQLYDQQDHIVSVFDSGVMIAQDILLPSHAQVLEFTTENSIRASLFERLKLNYESLILYQYSRKELIQFYEEVYNRLDTLPDFQIIASEIKKGNLSFDSLECLIRINNLYANEIVPIAKKYYDSLSSSANMDLPLSQC